MVIHVAAGRVQRMQRHPLGGGARIDSDGIGVGLGFTTKVVLVVVVLRWLSETIRRRLRIGEGSAAYQYAKQAGAVGAVVRRNIECRSRKPRPY
jgi:hypothetical protein